MNSIAALWCRFHLLNTQLAVYTFFVARILQSFAALVKPRQKVSFVHLFLFCFLQNLNVSCRKAYRDKKKGCTSYEIRKMDSTLQTIVALTFAQNCWKCYQNYFSSHLF